MFEVAYQRMFEVLSPYWIPVGDHADREVSWPVPRLMSPKVLSELYNEILISAVQQEVQKNMDELRTLYNIDRQKFEATVISMADRIEREVQQVVMHMAEQTDRFWERVEQPKAMEKYLAVAYENAEAREWFYRHRELLLIFESMYEALYTLHYFSINLLWRTQKDGALHQAVTDMTVQIDDAIGELESFVLEHESIVRKAEKAVSLFKQSLVIGDADTITELARKIYSYLKHRNKVAAVLFKNAYDMYRQAVNTPSDYMWEVVYSKPFVLAMTHSTAMIVLTEFYSEQMQGQFRKSMDDMDNTARVVLKVADMFEATQPWLTEAAKTLRKFGTDIMQRSQEARELYNKNINPPVEVFLPDVSRNVVNMVTALAKR